MITDTPVSVAICTGSLIIEYLFILRRVVFLLTLDLQWYGTGFYTVLDRLSVTRHEQVSQEMGCHLSQCKKRRSTFLLSIAGFLMLSLILSCLVWATYVLSQDFAIPTSWRVESFHFFFFSNQGLTEESLSYLQEPTSNTSFVERALLAETVLNTISVDLNTGQNQCRTLFLLA